MFFRSRKKKVKKLPDSYIRKELAPMIFYFNIIKNENFANPILPVPLRVDKIWGKNSTYFTLPEKIPYVEYLSDIYTFDMQAIMQEYLANIHIIRLL